MKDDKKVISQPNVSGGKTVEEEELVEGSEPSKEETEVNTEDAKLSRSE